MKEFILQSYEPNSQLLMVEDNPSDALLFKTMIERASEHYVSINVKTNLKEAFIALKEEVYTAILLDLHLPDSLDAELAIKNISQEYPELPIVILTGSSDHTLPLKLLQLGAQDYLCKNEVTPSFLIRSLRYAKERKSIELKLKESLIQQAEQNKLLKSIVRRDTLTGLPNRLYFFELCKKALNTAKRHNYVMAVLYFDLNGFKQINDNYGHTTGDNLLKEVGEKVKKSLRKEDILFRLSGDEFAVIAEHLQAEVQAYPIAKRINDAISSSPIKVGQHYIETSCCIGIAVYPDSQTSRELVKHADMAMYEAKHNNNHFACFYSKRLDKLSKRQASITNLIPKALLRKEFSIVYQPIINFLTGECTSIEALTRWNSKELGNVAPDEFFNIIGNSSYGNALCCYTVREASQLIKQVNKQQYSRIQVAINVTVKQLIHPSFFDNLLRVIDQAKLPSETICIEITESQVIKNFRLCEETLIKLRKHGVQIALDDYGTGFSSVTHLKNLPISKIKIDRSLIRYIDKDSRNFALTDAIIAMSKHLGFTSVAEGIERQEEYDVLSKIGCDEAQGFLICSPLTTKDLQNQLQDNLSTKVISKLQKAV